MELRGATTHAESYFHFLLMSFLGCRDARLIGQIWRRYPKSQTLLFQLGHCAAPAHSQAEIVSRLKRLSELIDPQILTRTIEKVVTPGKPRPQAVIALQERILYATTKDGRWRW
jgi:hypothetical protein